MKGKTLEALLRNNFENATGIGYVHETVRAEHQTEQTALAAVVSDARGPRRVRSGPLRINRRILPSFQAVKRRLWR
jgi:hypothetical protein